jgi:hypothetical protein
MCVLVEEDPEFGSYESSLRCVFVHRKSNDDVPVDLSRGRRTSGQHTEEARRQLLWEYIEITSLH